MNKGKEECKMLYYENNYRRLNIHTVLAKLKKDVTIVKIHFAGDLPSSETSLTLLTWGCTKLFALWRFWPNTANGCLSCWLMIVPDTLCALSPKLQLSVRSGMWDLLKWGNKKDFDLRPLLCIYIILHLSFMLWYLILLTGAALSVVPSVLNPFWSKILLLLGFIHELLFSLAKASYLALFLHSVEKRFLTALSVLH